MITDPEIERYCAAHTTPVPSWHAAVEDDTRAELTGAGMLSGPVVGRLLETLAWFGQARRVVEVGTFSGYGALALAAGLAPGGRVWTLERDAERAAFARRHIEASPLAERIEIVVGPALDSLAHLDGPWDLAFVDADKTGYPAYVDALLPRLAPRGVIALDNTLRDGEVLDPPEGDPGAEAMAALNERLAADPRLVTTLLPVRDGVTLVRHAA